MHADLYLDSAAQQLSQPLSAAAAAAAVVSHVALKHRITNNTKPGMRPSQVGIGEKKKGEEEKARKKTSKVFVATWKGRKEEG
jgi:hypothetical protein